MNTMRITISIEDITRRVYAISAVRAVNAGEGKRPAVLTRDNALLLRRLIRDCFAAVVGFMAAGVTDFSPLDPDDGGDLLWLDTADSRVESGVAGESLAAAVLGRVLYAAFADCSPSLAGQYFGMSEDALRHLARGRVACGRLRRHY